MDHFLKRFTIIDFLSMFVPGGILVLAWNYYVGGVTEPIRQFFGEQAAAIAVYFVMISYLAGVVLQEVSKGLEKNWAQSLEDLHTEWLSIPQMDTSYQVIFGQTLDEAKCQYDNNKLGRRIFIFVSDLDISGSKLSLFHAFYSMARNSTAVAILIFGMSVLAVVHRDIITVNDLVVPILSPILAVIMYFRSKRFYWLTQERAYRDFLKFGEEKIKQQKSDCALE